MKSKGIIYILAILCPLLIWTSNAYSLFYIDVDPSINGVNGVDLTRVDDDDSPGEPDQPFQITDENVYAIQVDNMGRRYVGVYIDRIVTSGGSSPVDNGENDKYLTPVGDLFSASTLYDLFMGEITSSNRKYLLPVPRDLQPGTEVRFRIKMVGPALGGQLPFPVSGSGSPPESTQLVVATASTLVETFALPLLATVLGSIDLPKGDDVTILLNDLASLYQNNHQLAYKFEQSDYAGIVKDLLTWFANSKAVNAILEKRLGAEQLAKSLDKISDLIGTPLLVGEFFNTLIHLASVDWLYEANVYFIQPHIEELVLKNDGATLLIKGAGFDPYVPENNSIYFTELNPNGFPVTTLEATDFKVLDENNIEVMIPEDYHPGPIMVCVESACSNSDVELNDIMFSGLEITAPQDGATVSGGFTVAANITNAPVIFPQGTAVLLVDGSEVDQKPVNSSSFSFNANSDSLSAGNHTVGVRFTARGHTLAADVQVVVQSSWHPPENEVPSGWPRQYTIREYPRTQINLSARKGGWLNVRVTPKISYAGVSVTVYGIGTGGYTCFDTVKYARSPAYGLPAIVNFDLNKMYFGGPEDKGKCQYFNGNYIRISIQPWPRTRIFPVDVEIAMPK